MRRIWRKLFPLLVVLTGEGSQQLATVNLSKLSSLKKGRLNLEREACHLRALVKSQDSWGKGLSLRSRSHKKKKAVV